MDFDRAEAFNRAVAFAAIANAGRSRVVCTTGGLIGVTTVTAFWASMPEAGDEVIRRSRLLLDTHGGATVEVGDVVQILASGVLTRDAIVTDPTN